MRAAPTVAGAFVLALIAGCRGASSAPDPTQPAPVAEHDGSGARVPRPHATPDAAVPPARSASDPVAPVHADATQAAPVLPEAERTPVSGPLKSAAWLAGRWQGRDDRVLIEETWTDPGADRMLATGRVVDTTSGRTVFFEFLRIEARGDRLVYIALPRGRGETAFPATVVEPNRMRFENPEHDDPKAIEYRLEADGTLVTRVEGRRVEEMRLRRVR